MAGSQHRISVVGTGYVGLTTGACLARLGHRVTCVDIDAEKIASIEAGRMPIYEEGLPEIVQSGQLSGRLTFTTDLIGSVKGAEFVFLCLPTPADEDGFADLTAIRKVAQELRGNLDPGCILVNKSTVPVKSARMISELLGNDDIAVVSNPEFLREGSAVQDFLNPDRIVVGADSPIAGEKVGALYLGARCPVLVTDPVSAESIKYMANAFLAMKISFVNQAAEFCDAVGANVIEVMKGLGFDPRIGATFLSPGPGWGGSCFPKDTRALVASARAVDRPMTMIEEAIRSNEIHIDRTAALILDAAGKTGKSRPKIGVLGLTFKSNTDDTRESPALAVVRRLVGSSVELVAFDPLATSVSIDGMTRVMNIDDALREADVAAILTEWPVFSELRPHDFSGLMHGRTIVDARYLLDSESFANAGFRVISIGR